MKEYIEREAVIRLIETEGFNEKYDLGDPKDNDWFCEEVNRIPAADVVEVVRCSDCEYWDRNNEASLDRGCYFCSCFYGYTRPTFYCAVSERKGGADDAAD